MSHPSSILSDLRHLIQSNALPGLLATPEQTQLMLSVANTLNSQRLMPEWNGLVIPSVQFRGAADTAASLGTLGFILDADSDAAAASDLVSGQVDEISVINGASPAGSWIPIPTPAGCLSLHIGQLAMTAPLSLKTSGTVNAASAEFMRFNFSQPVQWVYVIEGPPTNYAGASGTGSARMVSVYGVIANGGA